jgi:WXG100 family type VII secretion target
MAIEGIRISPEEVANTAGTIRAINLKLDASLQDIRKTMNDLALTWKSPAAETIRSKFNGLTPTFDDHRAVVDSYAKFLDSTAETYKATETVITNNASAFK